MALQRYKYDLRYKPGKEQVSADMLSRSSTAVGNSERINNVEVFMSEIDNSNPEEFTDMSDKRLARIRAFASTDQTYMLLREQIKRGWPEKRKECEALIQNYWTFPEELCERNNLVYKGKRLVVPRNMEMEISAALHGAHGSADALYKFCTVTKMTRANQIAKQLGFHHHFSPALFLCVHECSNVPMFFVPYK